MLDFDAGSDIGAVSEIAAPIARNQGSNLTSGYPDTGSFVSVFDVWSQQAFRTRDQDVYDAAISHNAMEIAALGGTDLSTTIRTGEKSIKDLIKEILPDERLDVIKRACQWSKSDDLLNGLLETKRLFTVTGFNLFCKPDEGSSLDELLSLMSSQDDKVSSGNPDKSGSGDSDTDPAGTDSEDEDAAEVPPMGEPGAPPQSPLAESGIKIPDELKKDALAHVEFQRTLNLIARKWEFYDLVCQLIWDWYVTDSCILYWHVDIEGSDDSGKVSSDSEIPENPRSKEVLIPGLRNLTALDSTEVDWDNSLGRNILKISVPSTIVEKIQKVFGATAKKVDPTLLAAFVRDEGIPEKFVTAVIEGDGMVELKEEEGDYWLIKTRNRKYHGLAIPSMYNIFLSLETRKMLTEGDFAAADMMKHFIQHVTIGESIDSGALAGQRTNWAKKGDTENLFKAIAGVNKASRMVTNHTVKFNFIFPPKDMFDGTKFEKSEKNIYNWGGVNVILYTGEGGTYGGAFIGVRRTLAQAVNAREIVGWLVTEFFDHPSIRERVGVPDETEVVAQFDATILKEPRQLLDELKFMVTEGLIDPRSTVKELNRDPDGIRRKKLESHAENEVTSAWEPVYIKGAKGGGAAVAKPNPPKGSRSKKQDSQGRPANDSSVVDEESRNQAPKSS